MTKESLTVRVACDTVDNLKLEVPKGQKLQGYAALWIEAFWGNNSTCATCETEIDEHTVGELRGCMIKSPGKTTRAAVVAALESNEGPWTVKALCESVEQQVTHASKNRKGAISVVLNELTKTKEAVRVGRGLYVSSTYAHKFEDFQEI